MKVPSFQLESLRVNRRKTGIWWLPLPVVFYIFQRCRKSRPQHVLNAEAVEFITRFSTTSGFGTDKFAEPAHGYVLYFISIALVGTYSFMRAN